jgi:Ion channel
VAWTVAHAAFDAGRINIHRIMGAVILYLYIGLIFSSLYRLMAVFLHPSFGGLPIGRRNLSELLYFSLSTLTTSGYGDIVPVHPFVRSLANLESVIGQLYPATFLARLVTLHGAEIAAKD